MVVSAQQLLCIAYDLGMVLFERWPENEQAGKCFDCRSSSVANPSLEAPSPVCGASFRRLHNEMNGDKHCRVGQLFVEVRSFQSKALHAVLKGWCCYRTAL